MIHRIFITVSFFDDAKISFPPAANHMKRSLQNSSRREEDQQADADIARAAHSALLDLIKYIE
ncbi:MAG TPA: hypothetical protein PLU16_04125 [Gallionellaceae bacterium]|jgi:hypothetical protein|nr:hypothetical protein [Gallionellaceae bacterium]HQS74375.1 hypothetical protein [Gallionellaceae bacterium]